MSEFPWLEAIYEAVANEQLYKAGEILFDHMDDLYDDGEFATCDQIIEEVDLSRLDSNLVVSLLSITRPAKDQLRNRVRLLERCRVRLNELVPDRAERLMKPFIN